MKAILIDAKKREVLEIETTGDLADLQKLVGGYIELVRVIPDEDLYVNEEGLLHGEKHFFRVDGFDQWLAGNGVILRHNGEGGQCATGLNAEAVRAIVKFGKAVML